MRVPALVLGFGLLLACAGAHAEPPSVEAFFAEPLRSEVRLSPRGERWAMLRAEHDTQILMVRSGDEKTWTPLGKLDDPTVRITGIEWESERTLLVHTELKDPFSVGVRGRATRLFAYDLEEGRLRWLGRDWPLVATTTGNTPVQIQDDILHFLPRDVGGVLVSYRDPTELEESARRLSVTSGKLRGVQSRVHGIHRWYADPDGNVRVGEGYRGGHYSLHVRTSPDGPLTKLPLDDVYFAAYGSEPTQLLVYTIPENGRRAVAWYDLAKGSLQPPVFAHAEVDACCVEVDPVSRRPLTVVYVDGGLRRQFLDARAQAELTALGKALPGWIQFVDQTDDGRLVLLRTSSDTEAPRHHLYDRTQRKVDELYSEHPALDGVKLSPWRAVRYPARDGLQIPAYLTLPPSGESGNLPTIVLVHGGPSAQVIPQWDPEVQFLASRGFAVFQPNFRGSTGYGREFEKAGERQWGLAMQDDLSDGVAWLVAQGIADPGRIGIYGASYGGYAALMGLVKTPELFRAGASYAGVTSIPGLIADDSWYEWFGDDWHEREIGEDTSELAARSPLENVDRIRAPVLLGHGENDWRVHVKHARRFADALRDAGQEVEYLELEHEVHGFLLEANRLRWYGALAAFFEKHLAPRAAVAAAS